MFDHPDAGVIDRLRPLSASGLYRGTIIDIDKKTFTCYVLKEGLGEQSIPARLSFPYCNSNSSSGIFFLPTVGSKVIFQQVIENGKPYAWILSFNSGDVVSRDFFVDSTNTSQNPGFESFIKSKDSQESGRIPEDRGLDLGDMVIRASLGNKLKIAEDGSSLLKSTQNNFIYLSPLNHRLYQWHSNILKRTPGSFSGEFNIIAKAIESSNSMHYAINRHFINPVEQNLTIQEEWGLIDKVVKASAGNFEDVPNEMLTKAPSSIAQESDVAKRKTLSGYNVYKRKVFDFGGRGLSSTPESANDEYYTEEIKADGAYRVRIGKKKGAAIKDVDGCEVYYTPSGEWSVGSKWGRIKVTKTDMLLSTATFEISLSQLVQTLMGHTHISAAPGSPTLPSISTPTAPGMSTAYSAIESKIPDPKLYWNT